jgi:hypothetical protein
LPPPVKAEPLVTSIDGCGEPSASTFFGFVLKWNALRARVG